MHLLSTGVAFSHILERWGPGMGLMTLKFELGRDLCTIHLPIKFHHPMFNRSEVIVLTNEQTQHPPRSAMLRRWKITIIAPVAN